MQSLYVCLELVKETEETCKVERIALESVEEELLYEPCHPEGLAVTTEYMDDTAEDTNKYLKTWMTQLTALMIQLKQKILRKNKLGFLIPIHGTASHSILLPWLLSARKGLEYLSLKVKSLSSSKTFIYVITLPIYTDCL